MFKKLKNAYFLAGCTGGKLTKGWQKITGLNQADEVPSTRMDIDIKDPFYNRNNIAADFGLGVNIPLNTSSCLKVESRFQYSLTKFVDIDKPDTRINPLILSLGYLHQI